jgi:hypothetical protein
MPVIITPRPPELILADIANLRNAITQGAQIVRFSDRTVQYFSFADLRAALDMLEDELETVLGGGVMTPRVRHLHFATDKGFR